MSDTPNKCCLGATADLKKTVECFDCYYKTPFGRYDRWEDAQAALQARDLPDEAATYTIEGRPLIDIRKELSAILTPEFLDMDYLSINRYDDKTWPAEYWHIAIYAVTGGSEGYYVHIDAITDKGEIKNLMLAKIWTKPRAIQLAARLAELLPV